MTSTEWAVIASDYVNGWGLADAIRQADWKGRIVCVVRSGEPASLMSLYGRGVEVLQVPPGVGLVNHLAGRIPGEGRKYLFFTEERSLGEVSEGANHPWLRNVVWYPGRSCALNPILDRVLFYNLVSAHRLGSVPRTVVGETDPTPVLGDAFFFRFRRTWVNGRKTPRIRLIRGRREWKAALHAAEAGGFGPADWCYQEVLSLDPKDNVSICGWHDGDEPRYVATHKVLQFPERQGNGDVCEVLPLSPQLAETTRQLLDTLGFIGPFELEFIRDPVTGMHYTIELNPRFWMQHPLVGANLGQALVGRYLGLSDRGPDAGPMRRYWVNTVVALFRLIRGDFRGWRYLRDPLAIRMPPLAVTLRWLPRYGINLAARRLRPSRGRQ